MTEMQMYWLTRLDGIKSFFDIIYFFGVVGSTIILGAVFATDGECWKPKWFFLTIPIFVIGIVGGVLIPTTKEMAAILVIPKIVNNQKVQEMPNKVLDLANDWLEKLKPTK